MFTFFVNDVELSRSDFADTLTDRVAFDIAFASAVRCSDKDALLDLLRHNAQEIIDRVRTTPDEAADLSTVGEDA